jgi:hypothetical protein
MKRHELVYLGGIVALGALLLANLLKPGTPQAFSLPEPQGPPVAISAAGESAWAIVGNRIYYVSLKSRGELTNRTITVIDDEDLK